jgi:hypothetical protein
MRRGLRGGVDPQAGHHHRVAHRALIEGDLARRRGEVEAPRRFYRMAIEHSVESTLRAVGLPPLSWQDSAQVGKLSRCPLVPPGKVSRWLRAIRMYRSAELPMAWLAMDAERCCAVNDAVLEAIQRVLRVLEGSGRPWKPSELARECRTSRTAISRVLRYYVTRGACEVGRAGYFARGWSSP